MFTGLRGKNALVTGSSRGIGKATALNLAKNGCNVIINYINNESKAREVEREIMEYGRETLIIKADVSLEADVQKMTDKILDTYAGLDILVNNAGIHQHVQSWQMKLKDWKHIMDVNMTGTFLCCHAFIPHFKEQRYGRIINISSVVATIGTDHECHYASSKAGVIGLTKALSLELAPFNITVNAIAPGYIKTDMTSFENAKMEEMAKEKILLKRFGAPEEIGYAVCFLASDMAAYITGETLNVNGGLAFR